jgi:hypothetical protein
MAMNYTTMGNLIADYVVALMSPAPTGAALTQVQEGCRAIARGIVEHLAANADVRITTANAGLQRDPADPFTATLAPAADVVLAGALE